ncbi:PREDICTED: proSAAS isoform X1 [Thamnophis sirtalis]|uniref:ProSAAS isoform X1 n=2 Tax=Thamnophis sirtalis TaxID=35019 RepID=A0A6I9X8Z9_9SAUR|nr:PREDICTED: proSAAS isoform X1 [Thamnophis sirtalis]XP_032067230.1 proSAAS [Thamnophis elegans]
MGPALLLALLSSLGAAKPLPTTGSSHGGMNHNLPGGVRRVRRELQGAPYEAVENALANEVYYPELVQLAALERALSTPGSQLQEDHFAQALERALASSGNQLADERMAQALERAVSPPNNQFQPDKHLARALQRLLQDGHRRDQESVYLANLLRLWDEAKGATLYPEYDETGLAGGSSPPRALPNRYWAPEGGFEPQEELGAEEEAAGEVDPEMLRYLIGRILSGASNLPSQRLPLAPRRLRRAIFDGGDLPDPPNLLRVKRLGGESGDELQRVKRTEGEGVGGRRSMSGGTQRLRYLSE